ncbi:MAG: hybrid sensor histidine kinase/response regulator [Balneolaceae bacterium]|nr:hybrid sensor histidine kinase/response regulator [Balneolaceae bacterium]
MPEMDGFEVCKKLKEQEEYKDIPVIFLSALSETDTKVKGFDVGGVDYITKPFQRQEVLARIDLQIKLRRLQQQLELKVDELREREKLLKRLNQEKDDLMRIVSHDFRNPVTGIVGLIEVLRTSDDMSDDQKNEIYGAIKESGQKLIQLVNNLLDKKSESSINKINAKEVNFTKLVEDTVELHRPTAINKGIFFDVELDYILNFYLDRHKIEQAISNLISNALKFTPEGGTISVKLEKVDKDPQKAIIEVSDTGIGMSEDVINNLWDGDSEKVRYGTSGEKGSGIGLSLVKGFVDLHDGEIRVDSEEGKGTSFIINLTEIKK